MIRVLTCHNHRVTSVAWSKDDKLASGSFDTTVKIWSVGSTGTFECQSTLTGHSDLYVFFSLFFSPSVFFWFSVDLCLDFLQFQSLVCGVEPWWKANCQRQSRGHHQDLGLAIWRLPVDPDDRPLELVRFFLQVFFSLCFCWFVCLLLTITGWRRLHGARMASWPAAAKTGRWRSGSWTRLALVSVIRHSCE